MTRAHSPWHSIGERGSPARSGRESRKVSSFQLSGWSDIRRISFAALGEPRQVAAAAVSQGAEALRSL
eukprot:1436818-Pyramimonas_sp.AAC.1